MPSIICVAQTIDATGAQREKTSPSVKKNRDTFLNLVRSNIKVAEILIDRIQRRSLLG